MNVQRQWQQYVVQEGSSLLKKGELVITTQIKDKYVYIVKRYCEVLQRYIYISIIQPINPLPNEFEFYYGRIFDSFSIGVENFDKVEV